MLIGWDLAFPEVARSLVLDGADLVIACAAWEASHIEEWRAYAVAGVCLRERSLHRHGPIAGPRGRLHVRRRVDAGRAAWPRAHHAR